MNELDDKIMKLRLQVGKLQAELHQALLERARRTSPFQVGDVIRKGRGYQAGTYVVEEIVLGVMTDGVAARARRKVAKGLGKQVITLQWLEDFQKVTP